MELEFEKMIDPCTTAHVFEDAAVANGASSEAVAHTSLRQSLVFVTCAFVVIEIIGVHVAIVVTIVLDTIR